MAGAEGSSRTGVVVVIGSGGMGEACARRLGAASVVALADFDEDRATALAGLLVAVGYDARPFTVDVADGGSVGSLVSSVAALGPIRTLVHTAGLSPTMASAERVLEVDLVGTAHVLEKFEPVVEHGTVGVVIASMAGSMTVLDPELERSLASHPVDALLALAGPDIRSSPGIAYGFAKRANQLRVEAMATAWGRRGARLVSVSPGIISTGMGHQELDSDEAGPMMHQMLTMSPVPRIGTA